MSINRRGGVWKNTEDEILKAAVMKYGMNSWSRISSLLVRKSAQQAKERWKSWLDPSIKKSAWTREEEEQLLHLAKIMPTQWRTIAGLIKGRTANQCLAQYELLLDRAQGKSELAEDADDPRRLRPGEIDPNPEVKPALPDAVDMDEDERDMLQEARARLANTQGKKAKRKDRERRLEEAKRLAQVRQRRELKAAGINSRVKLKRKKLGRGELDLAKEVPFYKPAPAGFFDTSQEKAALDRAQRDPLGRSRLLSELEETRRDVEEQRAKKRDRAKMAKLKKANLPAALAKINALNDPSSTIARPSLSLPAPQVTNDELELIAKAGGAASSSDEEHAGVTSGLLARVENTPSFTPMRTPLRAEGGGDSVAQEAANLVALTRDSQTPLVGGINPTLHSSDFSGAVATPHAVQTPHVLKTGATEVNAAALRTPMFEEEDEHARQKRVKQGRAQLSVAAALSALPAPRSEFEIQVAEPAPRAPRAPPPAQQVLDAAEEKQRQQSLVREEEERRLRMRSQAIQLGLPRPVDSSGVQGDDLVAQELRALIEHDNEEYPMSEKQRKKQNSGRKKKSKRKKRKVGELASDFASFTEDALAAAAQLVAQEMTHGDDGTRDFDLAWSAHHADMMRVPGLGWIKRSSASPQQQVYAYQEEFKQLQSSMVRVAKKSRRLADTLVAQFEPQRQAALQLQEQICAHLEEVRALQVQEATFGMLLERETLAAPARIGKLQEELLHAQQIERGLQEQFVQKSAAF